MRLIEKVERNRKGDGTARLGIHLARFQAIHDYYKETMTPILLLCEILEVSRLGYYKWLKHQPTTHQKENEWLMKISQEVFKTRNGTYSYRRTRMEINRRFKKQYNQKRIRRLMIEMGIKSHIRRSNGYSMRTSYVNVGENILNREFSAEKPNEKWVTDITHMTYGFGNEAYLSAIKDLLVSRGV